MNILYSKGNQLKKSQHSPNQIQRRKYTQADIERENIKKKLKGELPN